MWSIAEASGQQTLGIWPRPRMGVAKCRVTRPAGSGCWKPQERGDPGPKGEPGPAG